MIRGIPIPRCHVGIWSPNACHATSAALTDRIFCYGLSRVNRCRNRLEGSRVPAIVTVPVTAYRSAVGGAGSGGMKRHIGQQSGIFTGRAAGR